MNAPIDISQVTLETERLWLRPFRQEDLADFNRYASVDGVGQMAGWAAHKSLEDSQRILDIFIREKKTFALEQKSDGRVIGSIGIESFPKTAEADYGQLPGRELGYVLAKDRWGLGLMPEAVRRVIRYCFEDCGCEALFCAYFVWNRQSARVQEKCGFTYYKSTVYETNMGTAEPSDYTLLLRRDWLAAQKKEKERNEPCD